MEVRTTYDPAVSIPITPVCPPAPLPTLRGLGEMTEPRDAGEPSPTLVDPVAVLGAVRGASGDPALILHIMAWAGRNEAGVMGEEEALLRSLHFLELMTSLRAAGTVPLTLSGSSRTHHSPAEMQRGGADGKGAAVVVVGGAQEVETRGDLPVFAGTHCCSLFFPLFLLFFYLGGTFYKGEGVRTTLRFNHSFIKHYHILQLGRQNCISFIYSTLKIISL